MAHMGSIDQDNDVWAQIISVKDHISKRPAVLATENVQQVLQIFSLDVTALFDTLGYPAKPSEKTYDHGLQTQLGQLLGRGLSVRSPSPHLIVFALHLVEPGHLASAGAS